jgi:hypothetical protein
MEKRIKSELRIRNVSENLTNDLIAISKHQGFSDLSTFLKIQLRKIRDSYPDKFKQMPEED